MNKISMVMTCLFSLAIQANPEQPTKAHSTPSLFTPTAIVAEAAVLGAMFSLRNKLSRVQPAHILRRCNNAPLSFKVGAIVLATAGAFYAYTQRTKSSKISQ